MPNPDELRTLLARIRRRWFALTLLAAGGRAAGVAAVPLLGAGLVGWLSTTSSAVSVALGLTAVLAALTGVTVVFLRMQRRPDDCRVARFVEERAGPGELARAQCDPDALVSAVQVADAPDQYAARFATPIVHKAVAALRAIAPSSVISAGALRRAGFEAVAGTAALVVAIVIASPMLLRAAAATWVRLYPESIQIAVLTGDARVRAGQPLQIAATVSGRGAALLGVVPSLIVSADNQERTVTMSRSAGRFVYGLDSVDRSFRYKVAAGAATSDTYSVTAFYPPRVTRIDVRYAYPSFTRLRPRHDEDAGDVYGPAGTRVRLSIHTDKAVAHGELALASGRPIALDTSAGTIATADLVLARDNAYRVKLRDRDGLTSTGDVEYFIRLMDDRPPDIRILRPATDQGITPLEEVAIEARADDDYGVAAMELVYTVAGRESRTVPFSRVAGTDLARTGSYMLAAEELRVQPGDVITYYARARDVARGKRSTETRSEMFFLEVKPFNEEFVSAQSQAGGAGAAGSQIDGLIAAQKEIINATWNLERRAAAGRSSEDLKAVGRAQTELKGRVEAMLTGRRGRSRGLFPPQQIAPAPQRPVRGGSRPDPVGAAVDAMGKAVEQLYNERTADAIPHEMAALQGLLQAQAEVRRREVMQQSASAAGQGGTSRSDRDLSALFDRELQRQQRTNYESPQQPAEQTADRSEASDALDRVRDLARRQEELSRRLRDVANGHASADEVKRQLERLAREQEELRRQAEEIEQQLRRDVGAGGGRESAANRQNGRGSGRSAEMRRAAQDMLTAAKDMQRQYAAGAAETGEKAAQALREAERQIRGDASDARQRAAGELQLEAQQIAEGQRRVASEAGRLGEDGRGAAGRNVDARRRLAGEKENLADRVDELRRRARQLERELPGTSGSPFRDAVTQLERQRISERMRSSAEDMRQGGTPRDGEGGGSGARASERGEVEQQLSRALDSVVNALGGNAPTDVRRLTSELDRTREMRDRLDRLQRQVRDAEKAAANARGTEGRSGQASAGTGQPNGGGSEGASEQLRRAREEYSRELQRTRESLGRVNKGGPAGAAGFTPEQHEYSRSAPGNEAFKQDFTGWEALRKDVDAALEKYEASVADRLARKTSEDRLSSGGSDRVPEAYRDRVSRYFESIARTKK